MQPCIPVRTKCKWVPSPQTFISLSILIEIGRRFKAAFGSPGKHHNLAFSHSEEETDATAALVGMICASTNTLTIQLGLTAVRVGAHHGSTDQAHAGRFAFLANGPRACERRNGVDEVGVVLGKRYELGYLSSVPVVLSQPEVWMGHPASNKD